VGADCEYYCFRLTRFGVSIGPTLFICMEMEQCLCANKSETQTIMARLLLKFMCSGMSGINITFNRKRLFDQVRLALCLRVLFYSGVLRPVWHRLFVNFRHHSIVALLSPATGHHGFSFFFVLLGMAGYSSRNAILVAGICFSRPFLSLARFLPFAQSAAQELVSLEVLGTATGLTTRAADSREAFILLLLPCAARAEQRDRDSILQRPKSLVIARALMCTLCGQFTIVA
jgi:hypothetical protein